MTVVCMHGDVNGDGDWVAQQVVDIVPDCGLLGSGSPLFSSLDWVLGNNSTTRFRYPDPIAFTLDTYVHIYIG